MPRWSNGRVVLTGDAAWCPTPLSGIGTTLAMVGSYVLAGELAKAGDPAAALAQYARILRPFIEEGQGLPKIVPRLLWPHSKLGLTVLRNVMRVAGSPLGQKLVRQGFARDSTSIDLPEY